MRARTLHVINSAVLKLGKLTKARVVYRGISYRTLPKKMRTKDPMSNTMGGVEFGFTSCSLSRVSAPRRPTCLCLPPLAS